MARGGGTDFLPLKSIKQGKMSEIDRHLAPKFEAKGGKGGLATLRGDASLRGGVGWSG